MLTVTFAFHLPGKSGAIANANRRSRETFAKQNALTSERGIEVRPCFFARSEGLGAVVGRIVLSASN